MNKYELIATAIHCLNDYKRQLNQHILQDEANKVDKDGNLPVKGPNALVLYKAEELRLNKQIVEMKNYGAALMDKFQKTEAFHPLPLFLKKWTVLEIIEASLTHLKNLAAKETEDKK